jgi:hypothetical protein
MRLGNELQMIPSNIIFHGKYNYPSTAGVLRKGFPEPWRLLIGLYFFD